MRIRYNGTSPRNPGFKTGLWTPGDERDVPEDTGKSLAALAGFENIGESEHVEENRCEECDMSFRTPALKAAHDKAEHQDEWVCEHADHGDKPKTYKTESGYLNHIATHGEQ